MGQTLGMSRNWVFLCRKGRLLHLPRICPSRPAASRVEAVQNFWATAEEALQGTARDLLGQKCLGVAVARVASPALLYSSGTISWTKASPETMSRNAAAEQVRQALPPGPR